MLAADVKFNLTNPVYQWFEITAVKARKNLVKKIYRFLKLTVHAPLYETHPLKYILQISQRSPECVFKKIILDNSYRTDTRKAKKLNRSLL